MKFFKEFKEFAMKGNVIDMAVGLVIGGAFQSIIKSLVEDIYNLDNIDTLLKISVCKFHGANPNQVGNLCIVGHNYKNSKFFGKLQNIKNGDIIQITDLNGQTLDYKVYDTKIVDPSDTSCTSQLTNGNIEITLITCYYENGSAHASKRFIVKARV